MIYHLIACLLKLLIELYSSKAHLLLWAPDHYLQFFFTWIVRIGVFSDASTTLKYNNLSSLLPYLILCPLKYGWKIILYLLLFTNHCRMLYFSLLVMTKFILPNKYVFSFVGKMGVCSVWSLIWGKKGSFFMALRYPWSLSCFFSIIVLLSIGNLFILYIRATVKLCKFQILDVVN